MREIRQSGSEGGGTKPIVSPYPYSAEGIVSICRQDLNNPPTAVGRIPVNLPFSIESQK